jgi:ATP-dependent HslUV protease subunit HslV
LTTIVVVRKRGRIAIGSMDAPRPHSRQQVVETVLRAHQILEESYFPNPEAEDDDPDERSQITALIANPSGLYGVHRHREVFSLERFRAIGSGSKCDESSFGPNRVREFEIESG